MTDFIEKLEEVASDSTYATGCNAMMIEYCYKIFSRYIDKHTNGKILELGPAEGVMTRHLVATGLDITCVEGSKTFCDQLQTHYPDATIINSLFEDYAPTERFDYIVLGHVLEHVVDPHHILTLIKQWLAPEGLILASVPNALSLHRQAAVMMGLLGTEKDMSELDVHHGHHRVFDCFEFRNLFHKAGLSVVDSGGYWLKPVSNRQLDQDWTEAMISAFMALGERYPDIAAEAYVVAKLPK